MLRQQHDMRNPGNPTERARKQRDSGCSGLWGSRNLIQYHTNTIVLEEIPS
jgi:hypothetical protein